MQLAKFAYKVIYGCGHEFYSQSPRIAMPCPKCGYRTCNVYVWEKPAPEGAQVIGATLLRFQSTISKMGDRYIICIPQALQTEAALHHGKTIYCILCCTEKFGRS